MADEQLTTDNKRKLHDLNDDPLSDHLSIANGTPQSPLNAQDPEPKRPRFDHTPQKLEEATENGQHEKLPEELNEVNVEEVLVVEHNNEKEEGQEKVDEPVDKVNKESVVTDTSAVGQESGDKEEQRDAQPTSAGHPTSRKVDVPSNKVGVLIGKAGDTIRTLEQNSGARIHITRDSEADPGSVNRPVEIVGSLESINKAEKLIKDVIAEADAGGSPLLVARGFSHLQSSAAVEQVQIQVPNDKVKFIIGKRGEMIKNLQTKSGARIQCIPQHLPEGDQSKERTVRLTGDMRQIEMAKEMIKETITQVPI